MQWSKVKMRVRSFLTPALRKRIDFHVTSYRRSHDEAERAWVTVDAKIVFIASWYQEQWGRSEHRPQEFGEALRRYPDMRIDEAERDPHPVVRALAIADRRVGVRRLARMKPAANEHPLLKLFYGLRTEAAS